MKFILKIKNILYNYNINLAINKNLIIIKNLNINRQRKAKIIKQKT